jgi:hypothetical protein
MPLPMSSATSAPAWTGSFELRHESGEHQVIGPFPLETPGALRVMRRAFARVVIENHRPGLPVTQYLNGEMVETPADSLLPLARCFSKPTAGCCPGRWDVDNPPRYLLSPPLMESPNGATHTSPGQRPGKSAKPVRKP